MWIAFIAFAWVLGIAAAAFTGADPAASLAAAGLLGALSFAARPRGSTLLLVALGAIAIFGAGIRYDSTTPPAAPYGIARHNDSGAAVRFRAVVTGEPDERTVSRLYHLQVRQVSVGGGWRREDGGVIMRRPLYPEYARGDLLEIEGELKTPPVLEDFDYREYLLRRGIVSVLQYPRVRLLEKGRPRDLPSLLAQARSRLSTSLTEALPEPQASLAAGILLGTRSRLPADLRDDMNSTGTSHLVAVSGQNVMLVAGLLIAVLTTSVGRRRAAWLALAAIVAYAALVGAQPSVVRAAIMGCLYVMSIALGRQNTAAITLLLAAALMTAVSPQIVHDISFQLSFAAALGLILLAPLLRDRLEAALGARAVRFPLVQPAVELAAVTVAAIVFTIPLTAVNFHRISLVAPVANLFAVPAFLAVAATAAVTAVAGLLPGTAAYTVWLSWPPAAYMAGVVRLFANIPFASIELRGVVVEHAIAYYAVLAAGVWMLARRPLSRPEPAPLAPLAARPLLPAWSLAGLLALSSALLWLAATSPQNGPLTVAFLDVGQGDAILIQGPQGQRVLVDGGPSGEAIAAALGRHLPFHDRRIDLIALTHPQSDHLAGLLTVIDRYKVGGVLAGPAAGDSALQDVWSEALEEAGVPLVSAERGQRIDLRGGATLSVLGPPAEMTAGIDSTNEASLVLRLVLGEVVFLLTGDIGDEGETALIRTGADLRAHVLKVAHHGSRNSTSEAFLRRVDPRIGVISAGRDNQFGHPAPELLRRLRGSIVLRTDESGDVTVSTDGQRIWVRTQR